jgi:hypothetical protein
MHTFDMKKFYLKQLYVVQGKYQYQVKISNKFAALKNSDDDVDINRASLTHTLMELGPS